MKNFLLNLFAGDRDTRWWRMVKYNLPMTGVNFYRLARWRAAKNIAWRRRVQAREHQNYTEQILLVTTAHKNQVAALNRQHAESLESERDQLRPVLSKMVQLRALLDRHQPGRVIEFRVCLDAQMLFEYGRWPDRDSREMDYLGERLAYELKRQVRTIDMGTLHAMGEWPERVRHHRHAGFSGFEGGLAR